MEYIFEDNGEDSDQDNFQNIDIIEGMNFRPFPIIEPEIGAGDYRPVITETTLIRNEREQESPRTNSTLLKSKWFYYAVFFVSLLFLIRFEACFDLEDGQVYEVPFLEQMIRCNERRFELIHNLNIIHTALKRCTLEDSKKDEAEKMLSQLDSLYERHLVDLEKFTEKISISCKSTGKMNAHS